MSGLTVSEGLKPPYPLAGYEPGSLVRATCTFKILGENVNRFKMQDNSSGNAANPALIYSILHLCGIIILHITSLCIRSASSPWCLCSDNRTCISTVTGQRSLISWCPLLNFQFAPYIGVYHYVCNYLRLFRAAF